MQWQSAMTTAPCSRCYYADQSSPPAGILCCELGRLLQTPANHAKETWRSQHALPFFTAIQRNAQY